MVSKVGGAIAFTCNASYNSQDCHGDEVDAFNNYADRQCGELAACNVYMKKWAKDYGRDVITSSICNNNNQ